MNKIKSSLLVVIASALLWVGCNTVQPGSDPILVRTQQVETASKSTFELLMKIDSIDRGFWRTNAPAFHNFVEDLRTLTPYKGKEVRRWRAALLDVNDVKLAYQQGKADSNALFSVTYALETALNKANAWITIVTNR